MDDPATLTVQTKVWENDWRIILQTDRLRHVMASAAPKGSTRRLLINNVRDRATVERHAREAVEQGVLDDYIVVADYLDEALAHVRLTREEMGRGLNYSSAELVGIYLCGTEYLLHFTGDAAPGSGHRGWLDACVDVLGQRPDVVTSNTMWSDDLQHVLSDIVAEDDAFGYNPGFSDQMFLIRADQFRQPIYSEPFPGVSHYPAYGGELFEKRVNAWMRNHGLLRATLKTARYEHRNFCSSRVLRHFAIRTGNPYFGEPFESGVRRAALAARHVVAKVVKPLIGR